MRLLRLGTAAASGGSAFSSDVTLSLFTVNGFDATDGGTLELSADTTEGVIHAVPTHASAGVDTPTTGTVNHFPNQGIGLYSWHQQSLSTGNNWISFVVRAENGLTTREYTVNLQVQAASSDTSLSIFTVNGAATTDGATINLDNSWVDGEIPIRAVTNHGSATIDTPSGEIEGFPDDGGGLYTWRQQDLALGDNAVAFTVTAEDGVTTEDYTLNLHVLTVAVNEITEFNFAALTGTHFTTGSEGRYFIICGTGSDFYPVWFNTGTETLPTVSGAAGFYEVGISDGYNDVEMAAAMAAAVPTMSASGSVVTWTPGDVIARNDAYDVNSGVAITVTQQGVDPT